MSDGTVTPTTGGSNMLTWGIIVAQLIVQYGIPGAIQIYQVLSKDNFTVADLETLRGLVKLPSEY